MWVLCDEGLRKIESVVVFGPHFVGGGWQYDNKCEALFYEVRVGPGANLSTVGVTHVCPHIVPCHPVLIHHKASCFQTIPVFKLFY